MKTLIAIAALLLTTTILLADPTTNAPSVTLAWDQSPNPAVSSYVIYAGVASRDYTNSTTVLGRTNVTLTLNNLARGTRYYFAATCVDTNGLESAFSTEVTYQTLALPSPPLNLRATVNKP